MNSEVYLYSKFYLMINKDSRTDLLKWHAYKSYLTLNGIRSIYGTFTCQYKLSLTYEWRRKRNLVLFRGEVTVHLELIVSYLYQQLLFTYQYFFIPKKQGTLSFHPSSWRSWSEETSSFFVSTFPYSSSIPLHLGLWIYEHNLMIMMVMGIISPDLVVLTLWKLKQIEI